VKKYNFPKPVRTHPKQYLRSDVDHWIINGGVNQRSS
ncbi:MAG: AlpA family transcriptional regulator, partial [Enterobacterales bacterium]|nr:AlpA family transcriptional regulator [Enterobacterales bacterium]